MDGLDQEILQSFVEESREHLADVETELLRAEAAEGKTPPEVINQVFRCVHSIKGGAGFLGLERIKELSHQLENVVGLMREGQLVQSPQTITVLLQATDRLRELVEEVEQSNLMEIAPCWRPWRACWRRSRPRSPWRSPHRRLAKSSHPPS